MLILLDFLNPFDFDGAGHLAPRAIKAATHAARLKRRARAAGLPCLYANDNFGRWTAEFSTLVNDLCSKGGPGATIARILAPDDKDLSILKPRHSAFYGTPLEFLLADLRITRLIIAGIAADNCVLATALDAHIRKFDLWIPADCVAAEKRMHERAALKQMARTLHADIRPAAHVRRLDA